MGLGAEVALLEDSRFEGCSHDGGHLGHRFHFPSDPCSGLCTWDPCLSHISKAGMNNS